MRRLRFRDTELAGIALLTASVGLFVNDWVVAAAILVYWLGFKLLITGDRIPVLLLAFMSQYGIYLARRYRLTRTVLRGLRFHQTGSAIRYAVCAVWWWGWTALTLGFAYPFARAALERFKIGHTWYGDLQGRFEGSGWRLFFRGFLMWVVVLAAVLCRPVRVQGETL